MIQRIEVGIATDSKIEPSCYCIGSLAERDSKTLIQLVRLGSLIKKMSRSIKACNPVPVVRGDLVENH